MSLTDNQQLVVDLADGYNLVCALPGSGKTHTSIQTCKQILDTDPQYNMIMVTFTNAATKEMYARLKKVLPAHYMARVKVATFHALALEQSKQLKNIGKLCIGAKQTSMIIRALRKSHFKGNWDQAIKFLGQYGAMVIPEQLPDDATGGWSLYQAYIQLMKSHKLADFDMLCREVRIGLANGNVTPYPHSHILVDEFQDVDETQAAWVIAHGETGTKITVVGDDDQSIYGFRGSKGYEAMQRFQEEFDAVGHVLTICFRCRPEVLLAAKALIEHNIERIPKDMTTSMGPGGHVEIRGFCDAEYQAETILRMIQKPGEWAVIARTNRHLDYIEALLQAYRIPVKRLGGKSFWDHPEVDAFLKLLFSLRHPYSTKYLNEVLGWLEEDEEQILSICEAAKKAKGFPNIKADEAGWHPSVIWFHQYWLPMSLNTKDADDLQSRITTLIGKCREAKGKTPDQGLAAAAKVADILSLQLEGDFHERIDRVIYRLEENKKNKPEEITEQGVVTLTTMHGCKGLEWEKVIVASCCHKVVPSKKANCEEEERRLLYVAMTRAEQELYLFYYESVSHFLMEAFPESIPETLEEPEDIAEQSVTA